MQGLPPFSASFNFHPCANAHDFVQVVDIAGFEGNTAVCPVVSVVNGRIVASIHAMNADAAPPIMR